MSYLSILRATLGAFAAYFVSGGLVASIPAIRSEFAKHPAVYRSLESMKRVMPAGMAAMLVAMLALADVYAQLYRPHFGVAEGAVFGVLMGIFAIGSFVVHNYVNLNIGPKLTIQQSAGYFFQWIVVGIVISVIYRPSV